MTGHPPSRGNTDVERLRAAYIRRGPVEGRLAGNPGQAAMIAERDAVVLGLLASIDPPVRALLDIGCGEGAVLAMLAPRLKLELPIGVDVLAERVERGRTAHPSLDLRVADATALPFENCSFDAVLAMTVFSSVPHHVRQAIALEIARVLRPGGGFVWYDMRRKNPSNPDVHPFRRADVAVLFPGWDIHSRSLTLAPPVARRLGSLTRIVYPLLAAVPLVRTHEAGLARPRPLPDGNA